MVIVVLIGLLLLLALYAPDVEPGESQDGRQDDPYLDALLAAQRAHNIGWTARQAMIEEARKSLEP